MPAVRTNLIQLYPAGWTTSASAGLTGAGIRAPQFGVSAATARWTLAGSTRSPGGGGRRRIQDLGGRIRRYATPAAGLPQRDVCPPGASSGASGAAEAD